jgi:uncharacterized protein (DUF58 family)
MIVPTRRLAAVVVLAGTAAAAPALLDARLWVVWAALVAFVALAAAADALLAPPSRRLGVDAQGPDLLYIGGRGRLALEIAAGGWSRPTRLELAFEADPELCEIAPASVTLPAGGSVRVESDLVPRRRGTPEVRALWLRWTGPAGLACRVERRPLGLAVKVAPNVGAVRDAALRFFGRSGFHGGLKIERHVGEGSEFEQLREFSSGLDPRAIDWRASARHTRLLCRDYRAERDQQIVLAFDTGHLMGEPLAGIPKLDHGVNAGLLLAYVALRTGDRVGVCSFDASVRSYMAPRSGMSVMRRVQERTASFQYSGAETNFTLGLTSLLGRLDRRSLVVMFTDFVDSVSAELMIENLGRLGRRHLVLFVALRDESLDGVERAPPESMRDVHRAVAAGDLVRDREVVLRRLARRGTLLLDVAPEKLSAGLVSRYLDVKRRGLVS